jgi:hypothetical protein
MSFGNHKMSEALKASLAKVAEWQKTASDEEKAAMYKAQCESWVRAFSPCEHGIADWEDCVGCRSSAQC